MVVTSQFLLCFRAGPASSLVPGSQVCCALADPGEPLLPLFREKPSDWQAAPRQRSDCYYVFRLAVSEDTPVTELAGKK